MSVLVQVSAVAAWVWAAAPVLAGLVLEWELMWVEAGQALAAGSAWVETALAEA